MIPAKYRFLLKEPGPRMLREALRMYGQTEVKGKMNNPQIMDMAKVIGEKTYTNDDIAWCSLFMEYIAKVSGKPTDGITLLARSWMKWGNPSPVPELGDVLVFHRGNPKKIFGHVGLYVGEDATCYHVLGGNQADSVNATRIKKNRLLGARRLYNNTPPNVRRIIMSAKGPISSNEA
jgi:uncharacterized protein (TIGR02594 family)